MKETYNTPNIHCPLMEWQFVPSLLRRSAAAAAMRNKDWFVREGTKKWFAEGGMFKNYIRLDNLVFLERLNEGIEVYKDK